MYAAIITIDHKKTTVLPTEGKKRLLICAYRSTYSLVKFVCSLLSDLGLNGLQYFFLQP